MKKSGSFYNESEILDAESPTPQTEKLSSYSKEFLGSALEERQQLPCEWRWIVFDGPVDTVSLYKYDLIEGVLRWFIRVAMGGPLEFCA